MTQTMQYEQNGQSQYAEVIYYTAKGQQGTRLLIHTSTGLQCLMILPQVALNQK